MATYKNIVVAVDGSKEAEYALKEAIEIAKRNEGTLFLTHIIDLRTFSTINAYDQAIVEKADKYAEEMLEGYKNDAINDDVKEVRIAIDYGSSKGTIPNDIAQKFNADLIGCGATGLHAVELFLIGSVSAHIVRYAKGDVLVVRTPLDD